jgi:hypothetical protein
VKQYFRACLLVNAKNLDPLLPAISRLYVFECSRQYLFLAERSGEQRTFTNSVLEVEHFRLRGASQWCRHCVRRSESVLKIYADTSFLVSLCSPDANSAAAAGAMQPSAWRSSPHHLGGT